MKVQHQRQPTFTSIFFIINFLTKREKKYLCFFLLLQSLSRRFKSLSSYRFSRWPLRFIGHDLYRQHTQKNRHCPVHHSTAGHRDKARARVRVGKEKNSGLHSYQQSLVGNQSLSRSFNSRSCTVYNKEQVVHTFS